MNLYEPFYEPIGAPRLMPYEYFGFNDWIVFPGDKRMNRYLKRRKKLCRK